MTQDSIEEISAQLKMVLEREAETQVRHDIKMDALEAKLAKAVAMLEKAQTYIADLEAHEGSEGFSASTNYYAADYYDALNDGETK